MAHAAKSAGRSLQGGSSAVNRELGFAIENDKHLFAGVVKVSANSALWLNHSTMQKEQVGVECMEVEQRHVIEGPWAPVYSGAVSELSRIGVSDAHRQGFPRLGGQAQRNQ